MFILFAGLFFPLMVFLQKDMGTMIILCVIFFVMFFASPILKSDKLKALFLVLILGVVGIFIIFVNITNIF